MESSSLLKKAGHSSPMHEIKNNNSADVPQEVVGSCPLCGSESAVSFCAGYDRTRKGSRQRYRICRCSSCNVLYLRERCVERELHRIYGASYLPYQTTSQNGQDIYPLS